MIQEQTRMENKRRVTKMLIVDPDLYRRLKSKLALEGMTLSLWLANKMREEVEHGQSK